MKPHWILIQAALAAGTVIATAAATGNTPETLEYSGRVVIAGQPFNGTGNFKFVLLNRDGTRLWSNSDTAAPIKEGIPSGSVALAVHEGVYHVRLGDSGLGMTPLPKSFVGDQQVSQVGTWFDDGTHGWSFLGYSNPHLDSGTGQGAATGTTSASNADLKGILAELRVLRMEVAELRRQLAGSGDGSGPAGSSTPPLSGARPVAKPEVKTVLATIKEARRHSLGKSDAPVVLVEFTDYECGFCKRFFDQTFPLLKRDYIDTGKLRFVSRNMPVASHPQAEPAALALLGAAERTEDDYWKMRGWLFGNQRDLSPVALGRYADQVGLDRTLILAGIAAKKHGEEIQEDMAVARSVGITGTPSFVLGTSDGQIITGERITGSKAFSVFETKIRALLAKAPASQALVQPKP